MDGLSFDCCANVTTESPNTWFSRVINERKHTLTAWARARSRSQTVRMTLYSFDRTNAAPCEKWLILSPICTTTIYIGPLLNWLSVVVAALAVACWFRLNQTEKTRFYAILLVSLRSFVGYFYYNFLFQLFRSSRLPPFDPFFFSSSYFLFR